MSWKDKLSFLGERYEEYEIDGERIKFYALSTRKLFKLRKIAGPISKAIAAFFDDRSKDTETGSKEFHSKDENGNPVIGEEYVARAVSPELVDLRVRQRGEAIESLIEALTGEDNSRLIAEMIFDSAREIFPRNPNQKDLDDFLDHIDAGQLAEFVTGMFHGNRKAFGPLADRVTGAVESLKPVAQTEAG